RECGQLADLLGHDGYTVTKLTGRNATEAAIRAQGSPYLVHLATHGFFLPEPDPAEDKVLASTPALKDPMRRSGVALSGAQSTIQQWARGIFPLPDSDGVLTAEEVASLGLEGTFLVTLSACDTGQGEARSGEGVMGLRRGFVLAGVHHLLMTLWPVADA